jgi:DnaJ family protein C protein 9
MEEDPINNFFTAKEVEDPRILYTTLGITSTATSEEIRKAYRKLALKYHPDKHTTKNVTEKEELGKVFQRVGFAYAVLSDETKRKRYVHPTQLRRMIWYRNECWW